MKKTIVSLIIPAALLFGACGSSGNASASDSAVDSASIEDSCVTDSVAAVANIPFEVKKYEKEKGDDMLAVEYPVEGNPRLLEEIRIWLNEQLMGTYKGNLDNSEAFFRHYASQLGEDPELSEYGGFAKDKFEVEYIDDYVVTYSHMSSIYEGGAHGMEGDYGTTFLQSDGNIFTKECFTSYNKMHQLFVEGLKSYFKVGSDSQLMEKLIGVKSIASLAPPAIEPWITEDGVEFSYTPYEIAPYSAGSPHFTIPVDKILPYLTEEGKKFFGK